MFLPVHCVPLRTAIPSHKGDLSPDPISFVVGGAGGSLSTSFLNTSNTLTLLTRASFSLLHLFYFKSGV